ncbi:MAG: hypothetical protein NT066_06800, partial [Candidatus Omnitrophica bacterium]|nr:hypothetical protein [Candidatus Omnitrophota bacterium]
MIEAIALFEKNCKQNGSPVEVYALNLPQKSPENTHHTNFIIIVSEKQIVRSLLHETGALRGLTHWKCNTLEAIADELESIRALEMIEKEGIPAATDLEPGLMEISNLFANFEWGRRQEGDSCTVLTLADQVIIELGRDKNLKLTEDQIATLFRLFHIFHTNLYVFRSNLYDSERVILAIVKALENDKKQFPILLNKFYSKINFAGIGTFDGIETLVLPITSLLRDRKDLFHTLLISQLDEFVITDNCHKVNRKVRIKFYEENMEKDLSNLTKLLKNRRELKKLLFTLSVLRTFYTQDLSDKSILPPLAYAKEKGLIFNYNDFIQICPITQSFRRHILIVTGKSGKEYQLEIKMPGQRDDRNIVGEANFTIARKVWEKHGEQSGVVKPVAELSTWGKFRLYNKVLTYISGRAPLRIAIFEYQDGKRLSRAYRQAYGYLDAIAESKGITRRELDSDIAREAIIISKQLLDLGYIGREKTISGGTDFHLENFRLLPNGRVVFVADFGVFKKASLTARQKKEEIKEEIYEKFPLRHIEDFETLYAKALSNMASAKVEASKREKGVNSSQGRPAAGFAAESGLSMNP